MIVFTFTEPTEPPVTNNSVVDRRATAILDRAVGRLLA